MLFLMLTACNQTDLRDSWTYSNSGPPILDNSTSDDGDTGDTGDTGDKSGDTADTGDTGKTGDPPRDGTGYAVGDVAYNLQGTNQTGSPWSLYSLFGTPVVLLVGHMDLGNTMTGPMSFLNEVSGGAAAVALIGRNEVSTASTVDDAARVSSKYAISPVLYDSTFTTVDEWSDAAPPKAYVIDGDMVIQWVGFGGSITESAISGALSDL